MIESLLAGCRASDRSAQEQLYRLTAPRMFGVCLRYADNSDDAEDMLQIGYIKVFTQLHQYRGEGSFEGWIRKIMVHTAIESLRKNQRPMSTTDLWALSDDDSPSTAAMDELNYEELLALIRALPEGYRTVFNMYVIEGYSHKEIANLLAISEGTSKSQLLRARQWLQQRIKKLEGETDEIKRAKRI